MATQRYIVLGGLIAGCAILGVGALVFAQSPLTGSSSSSIEENEGIVIPVEAGPVERGLIELRRTFSASLEASASVVVASRVPGRVREVRFDIGDRVERDQVLATLDESEFRQLVLQEEAEVALAKARLAEAKTNEQISRRDFERIEQLYESGDEPKAALDQAEAERFGAEASVAVANAQVAGAEAALSAARIRLANATVRAEWRAGDPTRLVAERFIEEGDTVSTGDDVATVVEIDPIEAAMFVAEVDYARLGAGQVITIRTDAYPGREWEGVIARVSPVFREGSRQARVEAEVANPTGELKPGMFARVTVVLEREEDAVSVPTEALVKRGGTDGVFVVDSGTVAFAPVQTGISNTGWTQILGPSVESGQIKGRVVTLGHQLVSEGARVSVVGDPIDGVVEGSGE
ncbi:MAG: efflux RND transporter periplasmic adaptor subunit [Planctomycetota bacterium]